MTRQLKVYGHRERRDCFLPRDILTALGAPSHVVQGQLLIWATTTRAAFLRTIDLGLRLRSERDLCVYRSGDDLMALKEAREWPDGTVLATMGHHGTVASVTENPDRSVVGSPYTVTAIGKLRYGTQFVPGPDFEVEVTEAMLNAAINATVTEYTYCDARSLRAAIYAALNVQREARS
jgi:hypothetical protein